MTHVIDRAPETWLGPLYLRRQLIADGWSDRAIRNQVRSGALVKLRWGAYAPAQDFLALDGRGRHAMISRAVLLQANADSSLSHSSALPWFGAPEWGLDLKDVHIVRHDRRAGRREAGVCQHRGEVVDGDIVTMFGGLSLTNPTRTALEFTMIAGVEQSLVQVNHLLHTGQTTREMLSARYRRMIDWPSSLTTNLVLRLADARIESVLESRFVHLCYRNSIPMPEPQYAVPDENGVLVARLDFAWPARKKFVELDGAIKYEELLRPGERPADVVRREKRRDRLVSRLIGFEGLRLDWQDVEHERRTLALLRDFLDL